MLSALILFFAFPLRSGLYEDDTLTGAIKDMPILSAVCAIAMFGQFLFHLYNLLRTHSSESLTVPTISLILFPMLVLYFMRDIELYRRIRNTRGQ